MSPLVAIVGETASGKSALALALAEKYGGEIICADSWTVYRGFDIGTAKPTVADRARVPHHLLDVADPKEGFSAVLFQRLANEAIAAIESRGRLPILVGGTGLYIDSVLYSYSFLPPSDPALRKTLHAMTLEQVVARANELGLGTSGIDVRNKRRVIRLIENNGVRPTKQELRERTVILGLSVPRDELQNRVVQRVDAMLAAGLQDEVKHLAETFGWDAEPMKGVGYWQWREYFAGSQTLAETRAKIIKATMDLAKRQRTWFKRSTENNSIHWLYNRGKITEAVELITTVLNT